MSLRARFIVSRYVVCTSRRPPVNWSTISSDPSSSSGKPTFKVDESQQVFIGIFPASHIYIRDELSDAEGRLAEIVSSLQAQDAAGVAAGVTNGMSNGNGNGVEAAIGAGNGIGNGNGNGTNGSVGSGAELFPQWSRDKTMDTLREDDEHIDSISAIVSRRSFKLDPPPDQANSTRARLPVYPASIRSVSPTESQILKPLPPRPSLKSGDDTASGSLQPIIDEIASALREWHAFMFQYLARRDYRMFHVVREHIEALHLGRRQLLSQTLSSEETVNLRRECVARLVSGNVVQGLDVIVRHPTWGGLVTVDVEGEIDSRSWVSAVRMYAMQVSLAYIDVSPSHPYRLPQLGGSIDYASTLVPTPTQAHSAFPEYLRNQRGHSRLVGSLSSGGISISNPQAQTQTQTQTHRPKFYHVFLDLKAFVASPCAPGETVELLFSLYNKTDSRFVTEEFCAVLNHNGVLARDPSARIRTLFTDLVQSDAQDPIYLVCQIVRNGSMKMGSHMGLIVESNRRISETSLRDGSGVPTSASTSTTILPGSSINTGDPLLSGEAYVNRGDTPMSFRRPFGCAVLELTQLNAMATEQMEVSSTREHTMPIYVPTSEATFSMLHQDILNNNTREYEKSPRYVLSYAI